MVNKTCGREETRMSQQMNNSKTAKFTGSIQEVVPHGK
jgi:hypothetical protein